MEQVGKYADQNDSFNDKRSSDRVGQRGLEGTWSIQGAKKKCSVNADESEYSERP